MRRELEKRTQFEIMLADTRQEVDYYKRMVEVKQLMLQKYSEDVERYKSLYNQPKELEISQTMDTLSRSLIQTN